MAHLHAELALANERREMTEKVFHAMAENARLKASVELTHDRFELLKHVTSKKRKQGNDSLAAALTKSKAHNAKLKEQIAVLEKQLKTLRVRLADKRTVGSIE